MSVRELREAGGGGRACKGVLPTQVDVGRDAEAERLAGFGQVQGVDIENLRQPSGTLEEKGTDPTANARARDAPA